MAYQLRRVHGVGPVPCSIMIVGEAPGFHEDRVGRPFVGRTGEELDRLLEINHLPTRDQICLTNLHREYRGKDYVYTAADVATDEPDLIRELQQVQPSLIVPLGRTSTRWLLGAVDMDAVWGIPWHLDESMCPQWYRDSNDIVVLPIHHPASSFHNPEMAAYVVSGFTQLAAYLDGKIEPCILFNDPYPEPVYEEITSQFQLEAALCRLGRNDRLALDTEGWPGKPWSVQFSHEPGHAYLIRATRPDLLGALSRSLNRIRPRLVYHNALHDIGVGRELKLELDSLEFDDTMVAAYLLQLEPQGLKPLCVRHCGMAMQSYDEIVGDAGQRIAHDYISALWGIEQHEYEEQCKAAFWAEIDKGRRITTHPKLPKSPFHKALERCLRSPRTRGLWFDQPEDIHVEGYNRLGPMPEPTLDHVPAAVAVAYGCRDSDGTARVFGQLAPRLEQYHLRDVYDLELATYPLIERMSYIGIKPDLGHFHLLSARLGDELETLQAQLAEQTRTADFNANSGDQVATYLFDSLGLESIKDTRSGRGSTNDKILEALEHEHPEYPIISTIREYREVYKLKSTFVDRLPDFARRWPYDGRVHATFRTTRVVTGRLAASDPNLLAMPKHGKFAQEFRRGWVAEDGHILCEWDLSQIELRVLAHLSQDPVLLTAFRNGLDLHARLAQRIFGGKEDDHKKGTTRLAAKAVNFGIPMGMTCHGLSVELRKNGVEADEDDAQKWLDETMALYVGIPIYQNRMAEEAARQDFVRCLSGRIRYIGGINSHDRHVAEEAQRFAFSTPIQEGAQWIGKMAQARIWTLLQSYWAQHRWIEPLLWVHDAMLLEAEDDRSLASNLHKQMVTILTTQPPGFTVPIATSGDWGYNWAAMEAFDG